MSNTSAPSPTPDSRFAPTRLLVIDDDRKLCRLIQEYLEPMGYEVETAHTGPDGLEKAAAGDHKAVILDVMLPGMDGFEVLKQLRRTSTCRCSCSRRAATKRTASSGWRSARTITCPRRSRRANCWRGCAR